MNYEEMLVSNLALVDKLVEFVRRRHELNPADGEDLASLVKLRLFEDDYAVLRRFEGKSTLTTYLSVVVHRVHLDYRKKKWGGWKPSIRATRAGRAGVMLESLVHRDGVEPEEALQKVLKRFPDASRDGLIEIINRRRPPRPRVYNFAGEPPGVTSTHTPERDLLQREREAIGARASHILRTTIEGWPAQDQLILRMRYADGLQVTTIARLLQLERKSLYPYLERLLRRLRDALAGEGVSLEQLRTLLEGGPAAINFEFEELAPSEYSLQGPTKEEKEESSPAYGERETA